MQQGTFGKRRPNQQLCELLQNVSQLETKTWLAVVTHHCTARFSDWQTRGEPGLCVFVKTLQVPTVTKYL